ncbi:hypothetical protein PYCCODRAFT_1463055 [Trametes coccinea BRFM310]|uniref:Uncharacterized protein n=1 Tax=Trametes coccinea (strain BRFM310) TaxID=1353009 RepID=A0A1Y2J4C0_TRAC3|nr:hypothetical protein PYCCODRAFT_1463055 [Trametes coccinea BRFM310]
MSSQLIRSADVQGPFAEDRLVTEQHPSPSSIDPESLPLTNIFRTENLISILVRQLEINQRYLAKENGDRSQRPCEANMSTPQPSIVGCLSSPLFCPHSSDDSLVLSTSSTQGPPGALAAQPTASTLPHAQHPLAAEQLSTTQSAAIAIVPRPGKRRRAEYDAGHNPAVAEQPRPKRARRRTEAEMNMCLAFDPQDTPCQARGGCASIINGRSRPPLKAHIATHYPPKTMSANAAVKCVWGNCQAEVFGVDMVDHVRNVHLGCRWICPLNVTAPHTCTWEGTGDPTYIGQHMRRDHPTIQWPPENVALHLPVPVP